MSEHENEKRRFLRFEPEEIEIALLQFAEAEPDDFFFEAETAGLVIEEAYGGCALAVLRKTLPDDAGEGRRLQIKVARLGPMRAEIRWVQPLDDDVSRIGIQYLDDR